MASFLWTERANFGPGARRGMAMAYDSARGVTVMFGGDQAGSSCLADTWEWDGKEWAQVSDMGPAGRTGAGMVFAADEKACVLFGGTCGSNVVYGDTWRWDGTAWTQILDSGPTARWGHGMAFDSNRNRVVLFGGFQLGNSALGDTWEFDGTAWTEQRVTGPSARFGLSMAYDDARKRVVVFGGIDGSNNMCGDTWTWDGQTWVQIAEFGPAARYQAAMSGGQGSLVLMGGNNSISAAPFVDTWQLSGNLWTQLENIGPGPLNEAASVLDWARSVIVLFGGARVATADITVYGALSGNTWEAPLPPSLTPPGALAVQSITLKLATPPQFSLTINLTGAAPANGVTVTLTIYSQAGQQIDAPEQVPIPAGLTTFTMPLSFPTALKGNYILQAQIAGTSAAESAPFTLGT